jgi:hypothetical protein
VELVAGGAFCTAAAATLFPWTRFATGSGFAGAWALDLRWSMMAATAAVAAALAWVLGGRLRRLSLRAQIVLGPVGAIGGVMAIAHPPPFKHASITPAVAVVLLLVGATSAVIRARQASDLHR